MTVTLIIVATLFVLMSFCIFALVQDRRQRRVDRQLAVALAIEEPAAITSSAAVQPARSRSRTTDVLLRLLLSYRHGAPGYWPYAYTAAVGIGVATATLLIGLLMYPLWIVSLVALVDGCLVVRLLLSWQQRRYANRLLRQIPDVIELAIGAVRAGLPVSEAFNIITNEMPSPSNVEFRLVVNDLRLGRRAEDAIRMISERTGVAEYAILSVTLAVQSASGGRLAQTLQVLADTMRQRIALAGRAKALAAEATLSARVLAALPPLSCGVMYFQRPDSLAMLFNDSRGQMLFGIGVVSLTLGILTMRQMIRKGTTI